MAHYKAIDRSPRFLPVDLERQLLPGSFAFALDRLIDVELDLSTFDAYYRNDAAVFAQVVWLCDRQGLIGREMFAIDGVKLPGNASKRKSGTCADFARQAMRFVPVSRWTREVEGRRGYWKAVVAMAAKNARLAWAMLRHGEEFRLYGEPAGA